MRARGHTFHIILIYRFRGFILNIRTFFKIYSLPFFIVVCALAIYGALIMFMEQKNLIISRPDAQDIATLEHIAHLNTKSKLDNPPALEESLRELPDNTQTLPPQNEQNSGENDKENKDIQSQIPLETNLPHGVKDIDDNPNPPLANIEPTSEVIEPIIAPAKELKAIYAYAKYHINIRKTPSAQAQILARANTGEVLEVLDWQSEWSKIKNHAGIEGYVASHLIDKAEDGDKGEIYVVLSNALNVRTKPDKQAPLLTRLAYNARVIVLQIQDEWAKILLPNKEYGYISIHFIAKEK